MKQSVSRLVLAGAQAALLGFGFTAAAQVFQADFNDGQVPPDAAVYGVAVVSADGSLHLTDAGMSSAFGVLAIDLPGAPTGVALDARWQSRVGGRSGADGYSFNWVDDINLTLTPLCLCVGPFFTNCPSGYIVQTCGATTNFVYPTLGVFHSCPLIGGVVCTPPSGSPFPVGPTMVTCTASDCQTTATCKFTVTVLPDTTRPVIDCACLMDLAHGLLITNTCQAFIPNLCQFTNCFSDNCCLASCSQSPAAGTVVGPGTHPITVTIKDCAGNTSAACLADFVVDEPLGGCDTNCLVVANEHLTCATNVPGKLNYSFDLKNSTGVPVKYLFLVPKISCFVFMPDIIKFNPPLPPGQTAIVSVMIKVTGNCPTNLCFLIAAHDSNLVQCCSIMHCVRNPLLPTLVCRDLTVDCNDNTGAVVNYALPTANSPCCPGPVTVTCNPPPGLFPIGVTPVTCTAIFTL